MSAQGLNEQCGAVWENTRTHEIKPPLKGRVSSHLSGNLT